MAEYESKKISELLDEIEDEKIILPAMQRNFVWAEEKICGLFDSLLRDYPIGTFLFWNLDKQSFDQYVFNTFIKNYDEQKGELQRGDRATADKSEYIAVLDGQQRITSLYMGLRGKYRTHKRGKKWDEPASYYDRYLCLNLLFSPKEDEAYEFAFIDSNYIDKLQTDDNNNKKYWRKVSDLCADSKWYNLFNTLMKKHPGEISATQAESGLEMIDKLRAAIDTENNVNYYSAKKIPLCEVVDIFVRVNSGGQKLAASDLMLSVATGEQEDEDIHLKMKDAIEKINSSVTNPNNVVKIDKEMVLTAGLMFTGAETLSLKKAENYGRVRIKAILDNWDTIIDALCNAAAYIEYLGFNGSKLTSKNLIYPVAYYFYKNKLTDKHMTDSKKKAQCDRVFIRQWMLRAMVNSVFSDSTGKSLLEIRSILDETNKKYFPLDELMAKRVRKPLDVTFEQIQEMLEWKYGDGRIIPLLTELAMDTSGTEYDADHIWPKKYLLYKRDFQEAYPDATDDVRERYKSACHTLANLQILRPQENKQKSSTLFGDWIKEVHPNTADTYYDSKLIPKLKTYDFNTFDDFLDARKVLLADKIAEALPKDFNDIVKRNNLTLPT